MSELFGCEASSLADLFLDSVVAQSDAPRRIGLSSPADRVVLSGAEAGQYMRSESQENEEEDDEFHVCTCRSHLQLIVSGTRRCWESDVLSFELHVYVFVERA